MEPTSDSYLIVQAGSLRCALPLSQVGEVMRPLPVKHAEGLPPGVLGAAVVRGRALPVVSLPVLLRQSGAEETRFVVLHTPGCDCILSVGAVEAIAAIEPAAWEQLPKLLERLDAAAAIAASDQDLIVSLDTARILAILPPVEAIVPPVQPGEWPA